MYTPPSFTIKTLYPGTAFEPSLYDVQILSTSVLASSMPVYGSLMDAWCLDKASPIDVPALYTAYLYSSYELGLLATSGSPIGFNALKTNLDSINWLLNYYTGTNPGITSGDVQGAIWKLIGQDYRTETWYLGKVTAANVDNLVAMALANDGFVPDVGQAIGIIMDPVRNGVHAQPLMLETKAAGLGDLVWHDSNANGRQDTGEAGIAGATVKLVRDLNNDGLFTGANELIDTTVTDANGAYKFKGLTPGLTYRVLFETPTGYDVVTARQVDGSASSGVNSDGTLSNVLTLAAGEYRSSIDAGFYRSASLGDRVWLDANGNGVQDAGEAGVAGVKVKLHGGGADGVINGSGDTKVETVTDASGNYLFTGLNPGGEYQVEFERPSDAIFTGRDRGDDAADSDADATTSRSQVIRLASGEHNRSVDAGVYYTASLGDKVWHDLNGNGRQDAGEAGIKEASVTLIGGGADGLIATAADNTAVTVLTDSNGLYRFTGLTPGVEYQVQVARPADSVFTGRDLGGNDATDSDIDTASGRSQIITLASGENNVSVDAGVYYTARLGDKVWLDNNANGRQDAGEAGVAGVAVELIGGGADGLVATAADNVVVASVVTGADGSYQFTGLTPGVEYQVRFVRPDGSVFSRRDLGDDLGDADADTTTGLSQVVVLSSNENNTSIDAGLYQTASLGDRVWLDANSNGRQDAGEAGVAGLAVTLLGGGADGLLSTAADNTTATIVTDANGNYRFTGLTPGAEYQVQFTKPADHVYTGRDIGLDTGDSDADTTTGRSQIVTLVSGENNTTLDAGIYAQASLGDRVWLDANGNGVQDAGEAGVAGVKVKLHGGGADGVINGSGDTKVETVTDAGGNYLFTGLNPGGEYQVEFERPSDAIFTGRDRGDDAADSDADATTSRSQVIRLASGEHNRSVDAGVYYTASLGDKVWHDLNGNGRQDAGEAGIKEASVTLIGGGADGLIATAADNTAVTVLTDSNGLYRFTGLTPGVEYQVQVARPADSVFTGRDLGGNDATDSDIDTASGRSQVITLASGENNVSVDAGVYYTARLGDKVWLDNNANGRQDAGEAGVAGVAVELIGGGADGLVATAADNVVVASVVTGADGSYQFTGLTPGVEYQVRFVRPDGSVFSRRDLGDDLGDADADTTTGLSQVVVLSSNENNTSIDAGLYQTASLGDRVWLDANSNGRQDAGEAGVAGLAVTLLGGGADGLLSTAADNTTATIVTDADGNYRFTGLTPGAEYQVQFAKPADHVYTGRDIGLDTGDSDADTTTGRSQIVTLVSGENNTTLDAGIYAQASLGDRVWLDANGNGVQDAGEAGVAGVKVKLHGGGADGVINGSGDTKVETVTDASGNYLFTGLNPGGEYQVEFERPSDAIFTGRDRGDDAADSDADATTSRSQVIRLASGEHNRSVDAGVYYTASLGDKVWHDLNGNGRQDAGEAGVKEASVTLIGGGADGLIATAADNTAVTVLTDSNGLYRFTGLTPGVEYQVQVARPADSVFTGRDLGGNDATDSDIDTASGRSQVITLASGENNVSVDAGVYYTARLGDKVWLDNNANGRQDAGEAGVAGVAVELIGGGADGLVATAADNVVVASVVTGADGSYQFTGLTPGVEYQVRFVRPDGSVFSRRDLGDDTGDSDADTTTGLSQVVVLSSNENNTSIDAGLYQTASLGDRVWLDANSNGRQDAGEAGVAGLAVTLLGGGADGLLSTAADNTTATIVTDADGNYRFTGLTPGAEYQVQFTKPADHVYTGRDIGLDTGDSDADTTTGRSQIVTLVSGENNTTLDAGIYAQASLGDRVWLDANGNGVQDAGEAGVAGVKVKLHGGGADGVINGSGDTKVETVTDAGGNYLFTGLNPGGEYQVEFERPSDAIFTGRDRGDDAADSDADATTSRSQVIRLASGEHNRSVDAGVYYTASLGDKVWHDLNGNGRQDAGEAGIKEASVTLIGGGADGLIATAADNTAVTVLTDSNGLYRFTGLTPGVEYQVQVARPAGSVFTGRDLGGNDATDSDIDTASGRSQVITLASGENNVSVDAGVYYTARLGDKVWLDNNANGRQDAGEAGAVGVAVELVGGGADGLISTTADNIVVASTLTGADGSYQFTGLTPGVEYQVQFGKPAGYLYTGRDIGTDAGDSDADTASGLSQVVVLASGENNTSVDAGIYLPATLGDRVWIDANTNGVQDGGEAGAAGLTVTLIGGGADGLVSTTADNTTAATVTDASGNYRFNGLAPGVEYQVQFSKPVDYDYIVANVGVGGEATDSNADTTTGRSQVVVLAPGENNLSIDAGIYQSGGAPAGPPPGTPVGGRVPYLTASLGDRLWLDSNANGRQDAGEVGLAGQTVNLITGGADKLLATTGDNTTLTTVTGADGSYLFSGLTPGVEYQLSFNAPAGYAYTWRNVGFYTGDSDVNETGRSSIIILSSGERNMTFDAGVFRAGISVDKLVHAEYIDGGNGGTEGLTPGFWKNHADGGSWKTDSAWIDAGILPTESYEILFGCDVPGTPTLLDALGTSGGGIEALMRHSAAALLNAANPYVDYLYTTGQIIAMTQSAIDSQNYESTKDLFMRQNQKEGRDVLITPAVGWTTVITADVDANRPGAGPVIPLGGKAVYTYLVKNTGEMAIADVSVGDDRVAGVTYTGGDVDSNGLLDLGETWVYQSSERVLSTAEVRGTATASGTAAAAVVSGSDATYHRGTDVAQSIGDRVWIDANGDGRQSAGEAGAAGIVVTLVGGGTDGKVSSAADNHTLTTVTGADGSYRFDALAAGMEYQVQFGLPSGTSFTKRDVGDDVGDSDADTTTGKSAIIVLSSGAANTSVDAGIYSHASVGDRVWQDLNYNGVQDAGEGGIANVTVKLLSGTGSTLATTTTDANGSYQFGNLAPGSYKLEVSAPSGWFTTLQGQGGNAALDSEVDASGNSGVFQIVSGQQDAGRDIGLYRKASVGDKVWNDVNLNGLQDVGEGGVGGIKVTLLNGAGTTTIATATTNSSGIYSFANLNPGSYMLQFDKANVTYSGINLSTWKWGRKDVGANDAIDSDVAGDGALLTNVTRTDAFALVSGQNDLTRDAAVTPLVIDLDGGGIRTLARGADSATFDLFGNGTAVRSGWIAGGEGFLAVDRNGNGRIDGIGELFGGTARGAGFAQLAAYDSNGDGTVDAADDAFGELRVWRDADGNRVTDDGELMTLAEAGVAGLSVGYVELPFLDAADNLHLERSSATLADGRTTSMTDVYFNVSAEDAAAAGFRLPSLAELLGDDWAVDALLGGSEAPAATGIAQAEGADGGDAAHAEMAELLGRLAAMARDESAQAMAGG